MPLFDSVPREQYEEMRKDRDAWKAAHATLFAAYEKLRPNQSPVTPMRVVAPKPEPGVDKLRAVENAVVDERAVAVANNLRKENPDLSHADALKEAKRLLAMHTGRDVVPPIAAPYVPPAR